jgi:hypothetical protein
MALAQSFFSQNLNHHFLTSDLNPFVNHLKHRTGKVLPQTWNPTLQRNCVLFYSVVSFILFFLQKRGRKSHPKRVKSRSYSGKYKIRGKYTAKDPNVV